MADTFTPHYNLIKPQIGASLDTWGTKLNTNMSEIDTVMYGALKVDGSRPATGAQQVFSDLGITVGAFGFAVVDENLEIRNTASGELVLRITPEGVLTAQDVAADPGLS